jgi:triosephosphate isomerase
MRTPIVVGNWKLQKTIAEALALVTELKNQRGAVRDVEIGVAPVATALHAVV